MAFTFFIAMMPRAKQLPIAIGGLAIASGIYVAAMTTAKARRREE
jgi:hypothetical protein